MTYEILKLWIVLCFGALIGMGIFSWIEYIK